MMNQVLSLLFIILSVILVVAGRNPQVFYGPFVSRQYYALEYLENSPPPVAFDYNLHHGDVDAPVEDDDEDNINFSYNAGILEIPDDAPVNPSINAPVHDEIPIVSNSPSSYYEEDGDDDEDEEDTDNGWIILDYSTTASPMDFETTNSSQAIASDELVTEEPLTENIERSTTELPDKVIPAFVHPIHRPSSEWDLDESSNEEGHGKPVQKKKKKPGKKIFFRIYRRRRPMRNGIRIRRPVITWRVTESMSRKSNNKAKSKTKQTTCGKCQCGVSTKLRATSGEVLAVNELPWMALITHNNTVQCGGTLINDRDVLTAAHCVRNFAQKLIKIRFLEHRIANSKDTVLVRRGVSEIFTLSSYNAKAFENDIAILRISRPIEFKTTTVRPICLPPLAANFTGKTGIVAGWRLTMEDNMSAKILQKAEVPILSNQQCQLMGINITSQMLCAGRLLQGEIDTCHGESGGPLMVRKGKRFYLAGVVSWGDGCAHSGKSGIYAGVTNYLPWITNITTGSCGCAQDNSS